MNKIYKIFTIITVVSILLLVYIFYTNSQFKNNDLSIQTQTKLKQKEYHLKKLLIQKYNMKVNIPIIISDKLNDIAILNQTTS